MKTQKNAKWYWFIPIIGIFFVKQYSEWCFDTEKGNARVTRYYIVNIGLMFLQIFSYLPIFVYLLNLLK